MLRKRSLRLRYLLVFMVVLLPILAFSCIIYTSVIERGKQYQESTALNSFTYAAENISAIITQLDYSARTAFNLESEVTLDEQGNAALSSDAKICAALDKLESRIFPATSVLFYRRGDADLYTSEGRMLYSDYEKQKATGYDLNMSSLFSKMLNVNDAYLAPLLSARDHQTLSGLAYLMPFPVATNSKATLVFCLSDDILTGEFESYMGDWQGDLFLYDNHYTLLYHRSQGKTGLLSATEMMKEKGTGILKTAREGMVLLRVSDSTLGLHCVLVTANEDFYAALEPNRRLMLLMIGMLFALLAVLIVWAAFYTVKPIRELASHVAGEPMQNRRENELDVIRWEYDRTRTEAESLASRVRDLTPLVSRRLVNRLIFGRVSSKAELDSLCCGAGIEFSRPYFIALYVSLSGEEGDMDGALDQASLTAARFRTEYAVSAFGELPSENALCLIINFSSDESQLLSVGAQFAQQLCIQLEAEQIKHPLIGVGRVFTDPLRMNESFAEACAAVQLAPTNNEHVFFFQLSTEPAEFRGISPMSLSLLNEGVHRGERNVALRALNDILHEVSTITTSFTFFRFCCSSLLTALIKLADELLEPLEQTQLDQLLNYRSQSELAEKASRLLGDLCDAAIVRIQQYDDQLREKVMTYLHQNYKRFDLSIQMVAEETHLKRSQISTLVQEDTGFHFVQYISWLRMNEFKRMLVETDGTIRDLVTEIGYGDTPNFLRKFKAQEGITPSQYRLVHREDHKE